MPSPELTFVLGLTLLLGYFIEGLGIYSAVIFAIPIAAVFLGVKVMVAVVSLVDFVMSYVNYHRIPKRADMGPVKRDLNVMLFGTFTGCMLLWLIYDEVLLILLGLLIIASSYDYLSNGRLLNRISKKPVHSKPGKSSLKTIFLAGVSGGMFAFSRPPLFMHLSGKYGDATEVIDSTSSSFLFYDSLFRCILLAALGFIDLSVLLFSLFMMPFILVGIYAGRTKVELSIIYIRRLISLSLLLFGVIMVLWNIYAAYMIL
ncbi:MAG: TSUP family transporter [Candidatus Altiarchaeota archaeon]